MIRVYAAAAAIALAALTVACPAPAGAATATSARPAVSGPQLFCQLGYHRAIRHGRVVCVRNRPPCAHVLVAFRTGTGHEAELPLRVCGGFRRGSWICKVTTGREGVANARLNCQRARRPGN
jgi:hypothetical protein